MNIEPLLTATDDRLVLLPIKYPIFYDLYQKHQSTFWTVDELNFNSDITQFKSLPENDRYFIKHILAFFASSDGIINENLALRFYSEIQSSEARLFYGFQMAMEGVHNESYSRMIEIFSDNKEEENNLLSAISTYPSIKKLADWMFKWINSSSPFSHRIIAFACVEGILFSGAFCAIFWLKKRGLMHGLAQANELISRDEALHTIMATEIHKALKYPASYETIIDIVTDVVLLEKEFITESLPCDLIGMNKSDMSKYIEYVADKLLTLFGHKKYYNTENPFDWMDFISAPNKTNFFERRVSEYKREITYNTKQKQILDDF